MATQTNIPSDLTDDVKAYIFQFIDAKLNSIIMYALSYGGHGCSVFQHLDVD